MKTASYLLDTDWVVNHLNQRSGKFTARMTQLEGKGLAISIVTLAELWHGVHLSRDPEKSRNQLRAFVATVKLISLDEECCEIFGRVRGELWSKGKQPGDLDLLIAATALRHDLVLLSNNRKHFEIVEGIKLESI